MIVIDSNNVNLSKEGALEADLVLVGIGVRPRLALAEQAGLLAFREELHGWVEKITWPELQSGLVLLAMTFLGLPIMPNDPVGPFGGVNPREVWIIAIVLAGVSFLGHGPASISGRGAACSWLRRPARSRRRSCSSAWPPSWQRSSLISSCRSPPTLLAATLVAAGFALSNDRRVGGEAEAENDTADGACGTARCS